jgi:hypothetical protein
MPNNDIWKHFQRLERKPGSNYYYARCKFCDKDGSSPLEGRVRTLKNHQKGCKPFLEHLEQEKACSTFSEDNISSKSVASSTSKRSQSLLTSSNLKKFRTLGFMDRALTPTEEALLHQRMIEMIADNGISFNWIERPSTRRFIEALRPAAVHCIPSRRKLSGKLLEDAAKSSRGDILPQMKQLNRIFNSVYFFVCDGWVDVSKRHILGSIVAMLN